MKKFLLFVILVALYSTTFAQQYALFATQTMFDSFENPSQKSFTLDSSRKFSSTFFLPNFGSNAANRGSADEVIRKLSQEGILDTRTLPINTGEVNHFYQNSNVYLFSLRIFQSYKYQKEIGFAWQVRSDAQLSYTNETLSIFDSYTRFPSQMPLSDIFNNSGYQQSYNQFSFTYRENYNKKLSFGIKMSLLSGIAYNRLDISDSYLSIDQNTSSLTIGLSGKYASNFSDADQLSKKNLIPNFKNPGASIGLGGNYKARSGLFVMANIKDLGFIWWRKNYGSESIKKTEKIDDLAYNQGTTNKKIRQIFEENIDSKKFTALTNAKVDFFISKTFSFYKPAIAVSKELFYRGGDVAFVNTFNFRNFSASVVPLYNFHDFFMVGLQGKYQTPNFELFLGTDNFFKTGYFAKGLLQNKVSGLGHNGASAYMGIGIKFGNIVNHPQFSDVIPGIDTKESGSFFKRLTSWL